MLLAFAEIEIRAHFKVYPKSILLSQFTLHYIDKGLDNHYQKTLSPLFFESCLLSKTYQYVAQPSVVEFLFEQDREFFTQWNSVLPALQTFIMFLLHRKRVFVDNTSDTSIISTDILPFLYRTNK